MSNDFDPEALMAAACERTGLSDFGDDDFREPLAVLCRSLEEEAPLSADGRIGQRERVITSLANRLKLFGWVARHPEILEEDIGDPVVIAGHIVLA